MAWSVQVSSLTIHIIFIHFAACAVYNIWKLGYSNKNAKDTREMKERIKFWHLNDVLLCVCFGEGLLDSQIICSQNGSTAEYLCTNNKLLERWKTSLRFAAGTMLLTAWLVGCLVGCMVSWRWSYIYSYHTCVCAYVDGYACMCCVCSIWHSHIIWMLEYANCCVLLFCIQYVYSHQTWMRATLQTIY